ncbi:1-acyl-sn-glycerol-3-phosphate acyltransferase [Planococcus maitriensis]|uniref:1-acyl-sn-glycerol-3-phosphate acyltransferase n=1 Tax=Planococcus maitriensis TaxID=221799 RepID=A0A365KBU0_9BACL|nr:1-acyl-sn-glycerol-3-phosphate acyltransferase [Planococcus maitriensis]
MREEKRLLKSARTFSYLFGYLPIAAKNLAKFKKRKVQLGQPEYSRLIHSEPQKWASGIMKRTGSEVEVSGLDYLPEGPVLFVSNHEGNFDIPVLLSSIPKPFGFISKEEVRKFPIIPSYMEEMNCVFLDRTDRRSAFKSITDTIGKLQEGHSILIFPEGTRSKGQGLKEFKAGFMRIAKEAQVPVVPIAIEGTSRIMENNNNQIRPAHVTVQVLKPITPEELDAAGVKAAQLVKSRIEQALAEVQ